MCPEVEGWWCAVVGVSCFVVAAAAVFFLWVAAAAEAAVL
jgi:hypothetical protein